MNGRKIEQVIKEEGKFVCTTSGVSMLPLFADRRDTVVILPPRGRLQKYDVPLYKRGEEYVLHRIIKVLPDSYIIRGDNCEAKEFGIRDEDIIGVLVEFYRKGKHYNVNHTAYRIYSVIIVALCPVFNLFRRAKRLLHRILGKRQRG